VTHARAQGCADAHGRAAAGAITIVGPVITLPESAADLTPAWIAGSPAWTGERQPVVDPYSGVEVAPVPLLPIEEIDRAVDVASGAAPAPRLPASERASVLDRLTSLIAEHHELLAQVICREAAEPISVARLEVDRTVSTIAFSAAVARSITGRTIPTDAAENGAGSIAWTL